MHYPNGRKNNHTYKTLSIANRAQGFSNRGMTLEEDINAANTYYRDMDKAVIHKNRPPFRWSMSIIRSEVLPSLQKAISNSLLRLITTVFTAEGILILKQKKPK